MLRLSHDPKLVTRMFTGKKQRKLGALDDQLLLTPANKLSKLIKEGSLSCTKLCQLFIDRINQVQPVINALAQDRFRQALDEAQLIDQLLADFRAGKPESEFTGEQLELLQSPLLGVPLSVKESIAVKGMRNSCGLWSRRDSIADQDAVVVSNARRAGLIPVCTTNIPEATLYWADCQNKIYGRTRNPYDPGRVSGASSGGEASLIGSGGSLVGIGSDIGGSLRIPAHFCGIFSHKPTPFLVSPVGNYPEVAENRLRLFTLGPMCRYASDLKPMLKCLMSDKNNLQQDTYFKYQPDNISQARTQLISKLDETVDLSGIKLFYFNFNQASQLKRTQSVRVPSEFMSAQQEVLDHFRSKFKCQCEHINLDKFLKDLMVIWQAMLRSGGVSDRDSVYQERELEEMFGIDSTLLELIKMPFGLSKHTKESLLALVLGYVVPRDRAKAFPLCERLEKLNAELKSELESILGDNGVLVMPTMPSFAYKHNVSLLKTLDLRFSTMFNAFQLPVTHSTLRLSEKSGLPFGVSLATKPFNDHITIAMAEEIELTFGGWRPPNDAVKSQSNGQTSQVKSKNQISTDKSAELSITDSKTSTTSWN